MTDYYIRFFTISPLFSIIPLQAQMAQQGFYVEPAATNQLLINYADGREPFAVELTDSSSETTQQEVADFIDAVREANQPGRDTVLNVLTQTKAIIAIGVPVDYEEGPVLDQIIDIVAAMGDGLFHVEDEGFYRDGALILEL